MVIEEVIRVFELIVGLLRLLFDESLEFALTSVGSIAHFVRLCFLVRFELVY
jgi:hypothetical protein